MPLTRPCSCTPSQVPAHEKEALLAFKAAIAEDPYGLLRTWMTQTSPCQPPGWSGLTCSCNATACNIVQARGPLLLLRVWAGGACARQCLQPSAA